MFNVFFGHENLTIQKRAKNPLSAREREMSGLSNAITWNVC